MFLPSNMKFSYMRELLFSQLWEKTNILVSTRIAFLRRELLLGKSTKNSLNLWQTRITQRKVILVGIVRESLILVCFLDENYIKPRRELSFSLLENDNSRLNIVILPLIRGENHVIRGTITVSDKKQLEVVTYFVDECLRQNSQRGRQGRPPLNYDEVRRVAKSALHNIYSGSGVSLAGDFDLDACSFDPYTASANTGAGADGLARSRNRNRNRGRGGGGAPAGAGSAAGSSGAPPAPGAGTNTGGGPLPCRAWNAGTCTWVPCKFSHFCSKVLQGGGFCKKNHKVTDHK